MRLRLSICLVALVAACGPAAAAPASAVQPVGGEAVRTSALAAQVLTELNAARRTRGLAPLHASSGLAAAADYHSRDMAEKGYFDHRSADGAAFWQRVARYYPAGKARLWSVGENLLWSSPEIDAPSAVRMWLGSPEHRRNMLDRRWREIGIAAVHVAAAPGFYKGLEVTLVTSDFGVRR